MVNFGARNIPSYDHTVGFGYYQFKDDPEYISQDEKILLMKEVSSYILLYDLLHVL